MSFLDKLTGARPAPRPFSRHTAFRLTESGRDKLQDYSGDVQSLILIALETRQSSANIDEIARTSRLNAGQVERILPRLIHSGYVQVASASDGSDVY